MKKETLNSTIHDEKVHGLIDAQPRTSPRDIRDRRIAYLFRNGPLRNLAVSVDVVAALALHGSGTGDQNVAVLGLESDGP